MFIRVVQQDAGRWVIPAKACDASGDTETKHADGGGAGSGNAVDVAPASGPGSGNITDLVNTPALQVFDSMASCLADVRMRCDLILQGDHDVFAETFGNVSRELTTSTDLPSNLVSAASFHQLPSN